MRIHDLFCSVDYAGVEQALYRHYPEKFTEIQMGVYRKLLEELSSNRVKSIESWSVFVDLGSNECISFYDSERKDKKYSLLNLSDVGFLSLVSVVEDVERLGVDYYVARLLVDWRDCQQLSFIDQRK